MQMVQDMIAESYTELGTADRPGTLIGDFTRLVPDLVDIGVNVINPIQPDCMEAAAIKREFGDRLAIWGAVGSARLWDWGTPDQVRTEVQRGDPPWVLVQVSDTGVGIEEEILPKIFDPFFSTWDAGAGAGQGLAVAHSVVVDHHGGTIDVAEATRRPLTSTLPASGRSKPEISRKAVVLPIPLLAPVMTTVLPLNLLMRRPFVLRASSWRASRMLRLRCSPTSRSPGRCTSSPDRRHPAAAW